MLAPLLATATTTPWSPQVAVIMVACNLVAIALGKQAIQQPGKTGSLPLPALFEGFGLPELLATLSFGHILGAGVILGLANSGAI